MKINYNLWSFLLIIFCLGASGYGLYSYLAHTWLVAPPIYVLLIISVAAFFLAILGFKNNHTFWSAVRNWLAVTFSLILSLLLFFAFLLWLLFSKFGLNEQFKTVHSPDGHYTIHFYHWDQGATGTFGIRGELEGPLWFKKRIYLEKRTENVEVDWISNSKVSINNKLLDLDAGDTYGY